MAGVWKLRLIGIVAFLCAFAALQWGLYAHPDLTHILATKVLNGWGWLLLPILLVILAIASPLRATAASIPVDPREESDVLRLWLAKAVRHGLPPAIHGALSGLVLSWLYFALTACDLFHRNDILFFCLLFVLLVVGLTKLCLGSVVALLLCRWRRGHDQQQWLRRLEALMTMILTGSNPAATDDSDPGWSWWCLSRLNRIRCSLRLGPSRCFFIERVVEAEVDQQTRRLRVALHAQHAAQAQQAINAVETAIECELRLAHLIDYHGFGSESGMPFCIARFVVVWDLLRHSERIFGMRLTDQQTRLLDAVCPLIKIASLQEALKSQKPLAGVPRPLLQRMFHGESAVTDRRQPLQGVLASVMSAFAYLAERGTLLRKLKNWPTLPARIRACRHEFREWRDRRHLWHNWQDPFVAVLISDRLIQLECPHWTIEILNSPFMRDIPHWLQAFAHRTRYDAELQLLRHSNSFEESDVAVRRSRSGEAALLADIPELQWSGKGKADFFQAEPGTDRGNSGGIRDCEELLPNSFRGVAAQLSERDTRTIPTTPRLGLRHPFDPGPGRLAVSLAGIAMVVIFLWMIPPPWRLINQSALRKMEFLYRPAESHDDLITGMALHKSAGELLIATDGDGLHELNVNTFHTREWAAPSNGLSSSHLLGVEVTSDGTVGVITRSAKVYPVADASQQYGRGVDVRLDRRWRSLIPAIATSVPEPGEILRIVTIGKKPQPRKQVIFTRRHLFVYHEDQRRLTRMTDDSSAEQAPFSHLVAAVASPGQDRLWLAVAEPGKASRVFELTLPDGDDRGFNLDECAAPPDSDFVIDQLAGTTDSLWAKTTAGRLYQLRNQNWVLRMDGAATLDLSSVRQALLTDGDPAALWLVEQDAKGSVSRILMRRLPSDAGSLPGEPWRSLGQQKMSALDVAWKGESTSPAPVDGVCAVSWFNQSAGRHELLVPGRKAGIICVFPTPGAVSLKNHSLDAVVIETNGERVVRLDLENGVLSLLLETSVGGTRQRVVAAPVHEITEQIAAGTFLLESWLPDEDVLAKSNPDVLAAEWENNRGLLRMVTSNGRLLDYNGRLHGLSSSAGVPLQSQNQTLQLRSADIKENRLLAISEDDVVRSALLPVGPQNPERLEMQDLHRFPASPRPQGRPVRIATEPDGIDLYFRDSGDSVSGIDAAPALLDDNQSLVQPWQYSLAPKIDDPEATALVSIRRLLPESRSLRLNSLARVQEGNLVGPQIAIDSERRLLWRSPTVWKEVKGQFQNWDEILSAAGGTFVRGDGGIQRLGVADRAVRDPASAQAVLTTEDWWRRSSSVISFPVSAMAGLQRPDQSGLLVVAHAGGLSAYDPMTRQWISNTKLQPSFEYTLLGKKNERDLCSVLWSVPKKSTGTKQSANHLFKVSAAMTQEIPLPSAIADFHASGECLAVHLQDGRLMTFSDRHPAKTLIPEESIDIADEMTIQRTVISGNRLFALDAEGRLLAADTEQLKWSLISPDAKQRFSDIEICRDNSLLASTREGTLLKLDNFGVKPEDVGARGTQLQRAGPLVAAMDGDRLTLLNEQGKDPKIVAGGLDKKVPGMKLKAALLSGDDLILAGDRGVMFRGLTDRISRSMGQIADIDRFEVVGTHWLAWSHDGTARQVNRTGQQFELKNLPTNDGILSGPQDSLWLIDHDAVQRGMLTELNGPGSHFQYAGRLPIDIGRAAPLDSFRVLLEAAVVGASQTATQPFLYDVRSHSLHVVNSAENLSDWDVFPLGSRPLVKSETGSKINVFDVAVSPPALRSLVTGADEILQTREALFWLADRTINKLTQDTGPDQIMQLPKKPEKPVAMQSPITEVVLASDGASFWGTDGNSAVRYDADRGIADPRAGIVSLARLGTQVVGIRGEANKLTVIDLATDRAVSETFENFGCDDERIVAWTMFDQGLSVQLLTGEADLKRDMQTSVRPELDKLDSTKMASINARHLFLLGNSGHLVHYDAETSNWRSLPDQFGVWDAIGVVDGHVLVKRSVESKAENRTETTTEIRMVSDGTEIRTENESWSVPGTAWFSESGFAELDFTEKDSNGVVRAKLHQLDGKLVELATFKRATPSFRPVDSRLLELPNRNRLLWLQGPQLQLFLNRGNMLTKIDSPAQMTLNLPAADGVFYGQAGEIYYADASQQLVRIRLNENRAEVVRNSVLALGRIGDLLCAVCPARQGIELIAVESELDIPRPIQSLLARAQPTTLFSKVASDSSLHITLRRSDPKHGDIEIALVVRDQRLLVSSWGQPRPPAATPVEERLSSPTGDHGILLGGGVFLRSDGWLNSDLPRSFAADNKLDSSVPFEMEDGNIRLLSSLNPQWNADRFQSELTAVSDHFPIESGELRSVSGTRFGVLNSKQPLDSDVWAEARPLPDGSVCVLDNLGQIWRWYIRNGEFVRTLISAARPTASVAPRHLALPAAAGQQGVFVLDADRRVIGKVLDKALVLAGVVDFATVDRIGKRNGVLGAIRWDVDDRRDLHFSLRIAAGVADKNQEPPKWLPITLSTAGSSVDWPVALRTFRNAPGLWLELPLRKEAGGKAVICPAKPQGRFLDARFADPSELQDTWRQPRAPFNVDGLRFEPNVVQDRGWKIFGGPQRNQLISVHQGRLATDILIDGVSLVDRQNHRSVFLLTKQPSVLLQQNWPNAGPGSVEWLPLDDRLAASMDLRVRDQQLYALTADQTSYRLDLQGPVWTKADVNWRETVAAASRWSFDQGGLVSYDGVQMPVLADQQNGEHSAFAFAADVVGSHVDPNEVVRFDTLGDHVVFKSQSGQWFRYRPEDAIAIPVTSIPEVSWTSIRLDTLQAELPRRLCDGSKYSIETDTGEPIHLPYTLRRGRMPHHQLKLVAACGQEHLTLEFDAEEPLYGVADLALPAPRISYARSKSPLLPASAYDEHTGFRISSRSENRLSWSESLISPEMLLSDGLEKEPGSLGSLFGNGFAFDDPQNILPVRYIDTGELVFQFMPDQRVWKRTVDPGLDLFKRFDEPSFPAPMKDQSARLTVDQQSGRLTRWTLDAPPGTSVAPLHLGAFSLDGRYQPERSASVHEDSPEHLRLVSKAGFGSVGVDITMVRTEAGWKFPFESPTDVIHSADGGWNLLDGTSKVQGTWSGAGQLVRIQRSDAQQLWRNQTGEIRSSGSPTSDAGGPPDPGAEVEFINDSFALQRNVETSRYQFVWRNGEDWQVVRNPWLGLPGTHFTAVIRLGGDLVLQDRFGIRRMRSGEELFLPTKSVRPERLVRHAGRVMLPSPAIAESELVTTAEQPDDATGLVVVKPAEALAMIIENWEIRQSQPQQPVEVYARLQSGLLPLHPCDPVFTPEVPGEHYTERITNGLLSIDRPLLLENDGSGVLVVVPAGVGNVGDDSVIRLTPAFDPDIRAWMHDAASLVLLRSDDARLSLSNPDSPSWVVEIGPVFNLRQRQKNDVNYLSYNGRRGWKLASGSEGRVLSRGVELQEDEFIEDKMVGDEIFRGGQFSFDYVESVKRANYGDGDCLIVETARTVERLDLTTVTPRLVVSELQPRRQMTLPSPGDLHVTQEPRGGSAMWKLAMPSESIFLSPSAVPVLLQSDSSPQAVLFDNRIWIATPAGIYWVEASDRWARFRRNPLAVSP